MSNNVQLLLSDARGVYIPRDFVQGFDVTKWGLDPESWAVVTCNDPDAEGYWDAWSDICEEARHVDKDGIEWTLWQDGDLWAVAYDNMSDEEKKEFFGDF